MLTAIMVFNFSDKNTYIFFPLNELSKHCLPIYTYFCEKDFQHIDGIYLNFVYCLCVYFDFSL